MARRFLTSSAHRQVEAVARVDGVIARVLGAGMSYMPQSPIEDWLKCPFSFGPDSDLAAFLAQLEEQSLAHIEHGELLLPWESVYLIMRSLDYGPSFPLLRIPALSSLRPSLASSGSFSDKDFSISVSGWIRADGSALMGNARITGAIIEAITETPQRGLIEEEVLLTLRAIDAFHQQPHETRNTRSNRLSWASIRRHATAAKAQLTHFLSSTVVITPEKLELGLRKTDLAGGKVVEVTPNFSGQPPNWIKTFDRFSEVRDFYEVPQEDGLFYVEISPEVKTVLREIKRMPARRVSGQRAEAFLRNPFAALGPDAATVINPERYEEERAKAGITFSTFTALVKRNDGSRLSEVALRVERGSAPGPPCEFLPFSGPDDLGVFIEKIDGKIKRGAQCLQWKGHELEILGDTPDQLDILRRALTEWSTGAGSPNSPFFDLTLYSDRVAGFGVEIPYSSVYIKGRTHNNHWFPTSCSARGDFHAWDQPMKVPLTGMNLTAFCDALQTAKNEKRVEFEVPFLPAPLLVSQGEVMLKALGPLQTDVTILLPGEDDWPDTSRPTKQGLIVKPNVDHLDYEEPCGLLAFDHARKPLLPSTLRPQIRLKDHQLVGVAWLQHLWSLGPHACRGALFADDMGLGKTIQLLTFIAHRLEEDPRIDPFLIVAPVSLLENWEEEIEKFFEPATLPVLALYGHALNQRRLPQSEIDDELLRGGIVDLLSRGWLGAAKLVLTTYETLRDLEFTFARQKWSAVICDEAQKIKAPDAMVTRAAKKQNARFKIACTGTPVENTLTDLWCLFDFVQPGLLSSLQSFGDMYRWPIEAVTAQEKSRIDELRLKIKPLILRRTISEVEQELPPKVVDNNCRSIPISQRQRDYYATAMSQFRWRNGSTLPTGMQTPLGLLQYLRVLCSDPKPPGTQSLGQMSIAEIAEHSPKLHWLLAELGRIKALAEKAIVFCEFKDLQRTLQRCIVESTGFPVEIINGDSSTAAGNGKSRQARIKRFQERDGFGVIILSPLAVGFGLNIQAANHVIHFTRAWNPAREDQATARAYRLGQDKTVFVYYPTLVAGDFATFDVRLHRLLETKRKLSKDILNGSGDIGPNDFKDLQGPAGLTCFGNGRCSQ